MNLDVQHLDIPDIKIFSPKKHGDSRGFFSETYNKRDMAEAGVVLDFVQDNHSLSQQAGTVRGLHYQAPPFAQDKLVRVVSGSILDVVVDLRRNSPTFGKWVAAEISAENWNQILVPIGFAHATCTLVPNTQMIYKVSNYYAPKHDFGIRWNDEDLGIDWPFPDNKLILSDKDKTQPFFKELTSWF